MELNRDFRDLFAALNAARAEYLLVGGYAVALHAAPRFTKDIDVWVGTSETNAPRVFEALQRFGAPLADISVADFATPGLVFQMGVPPNRIDILMSVEGLDFGECWSRRVGVPYGDVPIHVVGREDLIRNKRAVARPQDIADAEALERHRPRK